MMKRPVDRHFEIIQKFGKTGFARKHADWYELFGGIHSGLDFDVPPGTEVWATLNGYVVRREYHKGMGNVIAIRTGNIYALYAHLSKFKVKLGAYVKEGDLIGFSGETGKALTEPHLHFELRDLTKKTLREKIFAPDFRLNLPRQFKCEFRYEVHSRQNLSDLGLKFFGHRNTWPVLRKANPKFRKRNPGWIIKIGTRVKIPQFYEWRFVTQILSKTDRGSSPRPFGKIAR